MILYALRNFYTLGVMLIILENSQTSILSESSEEISLIPLIAIRLILSIIYIFNPSRTILLYSSMQFIQFVSIFLVRNTYMMAPLVLEIPADIIYGVCKAQRKGNFDSRLSYSSFILGLFFIKFQGILVNIRF